MKRRNETDPATFAYLRRREEAASLSLDKTPIGEAWRLLLPSWISADPYGSSRTIAFLKKAPELVKSGSADPAVRLYDCDQVDREAEGFCYAIGFAVFAAPPSPEELHSLRTYASINRKARALRADFASLGLSDLDLFFAFQNPENTDPLARKLREIFTTNVEVQLAVRRAAQEKPGSCRDVLQWITKARRPYIGAKRWDPASPPRNEAMACLDAFVCVLANYFDDIPLTVATRCAIACHPEQERGIRNRAARLAVRYGDRISKRAGHSWFDAELSPLFSSKVP
jgi:hypothetical protein